MISERNKYLLLNYIYFLIKLKNKYNLIINIITNKIIIIKKIEIIIYCIK